MAMSYKFTYSTKSFYSKDSKGIIKTLKGKFPTHLSKSFIMKLIRNAGKWVKK